MLRVLELFGGIGACSKALKRLKIPYEIADYVEIDKYAVKSFNAIHKTNFEPQDICQWDKDIDVDLIMHGSPCQDFSVAGKQLGGDENSGTRSSLMYETIRIVDKLRPKYVIWENVKNVISRKHKHNWDKYVQRMKELGYTSYAKVMNAKNYGIPQNRERVFTISIRDDLNQEFKFPKPKPLKLKLKDMLENKVDEKYYLSDKAIIYALDLNNVQVGTKWEGSTANGSINKDIAMTIGCRSASSQRAGITNYVLDNCEKEIPVKTLKQQLCNELIKKGKVEENDMIRHSYTTWRKEKEFHTENKRNNNISATLTTRPDTLGVTVNQPPLRIRKLTPKECWRLMGFDDEDFDKAEKVNSNAQLYKQAGNSIVVNVLQEILKELIKENK